MSPCCCLWGWVQTWEGTQSETLSQPGSLCTPVRGDLPPSHSRAQSHPQASQALFPPRHRTSGQHPAPLACGAHEKSDGHVLGHCGDGGDLKGPSPLRTSLLLGSPASPEGPGLPESQRHTGCPPFTREQATGSVKPSY